MLFEAQNLSARRGEDLLFQNISFALESGQALTVTGPNGSGKSTLLRVLAGLLHAESGSVSVNGYERAAEACHYLGHRNAMKRELSVYENLEFWRDFMGATGQSVEDAADAVGLESILHLPFGYLSAGQQRRIAMAKLLVTERPIWLLDEPTAALDAASDELFSTLCRSFQSNGGIIVAATHQPLGLSNPKQLVMKGFAYDASDAF